VIDLQSTLQRRFPAWFAGARRHLTVPAVRSLSRLSRIDAINAFLKASAHRRGMDFVDASLDFLNCRYLLDHVERERIPERGRVVIVANHPLGAIDALALLRAVGEVRRDVRVLANDFLELLSGLAGRRGTGARGGGDRLPRRRGVAPDADRHQGRALAARLPQVRATRRRAGAAGAHRRPQLGVVLRAVGAVQATGHGTAAA
jgi:hypothetical protein